MIVFDLDGTLVDDRGRIHPVDAALLGEANPPVIYVPATGRGIATVRGSFHHAGLFTGRPIPFPMVVQNGAALYLEGERLFAYTAFAPALQAELIRLALRFSGVTFFFLNREENYILWPNDYSLKTAEGYGLECLSLSPEMYGCPFSKVMCFSDAPEALAEVARASQSLDMGRFYSLPTIFEMCPPGVDKSSGLNKLLAAAGLSGAVVYTAGDGENDLGLFRRAARSFTPATSPAAIQSQADRVVDMRSRGILSWMLEEALAHPAVGG